MPSQSIEELRRALQEAEERERSEAQARRDAVELQWKYTLTPDEREAAYYRSRVYDPSVRFYRLEGTIVNREEALTAGHDLSHREGGMTYLFNTLSHKIVMPLSGGTVFVSDHNRDRALHTFEALSVFLITHPDGGDVTEIVKRHRTT